MNDLQTVAGVEAELQQAEAVYEAARKATLESWQLKRKHLRALLAVLKDQQAETHANDSE